MLGALKLKRSSSEDDVKSKGYYTSVTTACLCFMAGSFVLSACGGPSGEARSPSPSETAASEAASTSSGAPATLEPESVAASDSNGSPPAGAEAARPGAEDGAAKASTPAPAADPRETSPDSEAAAAAKLAAELEKRRKAAKAQTEDEGETSEDEAAPPEPPASGYTGPDPCRAHSFSVERVREACATGGRPAAKRVMKDAITKAIATSHSLGCSDCHANQRDYALKPKAVAELKRWLEVSE